MLLEYKYRKRIGIGCVSRWNVLELYNKFIKELTPGAKLQE